MKKTLLIASAIIAIGAVSAQGVPTKKDNVTSGSAPQSGTVASPTSTSKATPSNRPGSTSSTAISTNGSGPNKGGTVGGTSVQGPKTSPAIQAAPAKSGSTPASSSSNSNAPKK